MCKYILPVDVLRIKVFFPFEEHKTAVYPSDTFSSEDNILSVFIIRSPASNKMADQIVKYVILLQTVRRTDLTVSVQRGEAEGRGRQSENVGQVQVLEGH